MIKPLLLLDISQRESTVGALFHFSHIGGGSGRLAQMWESLLTTKGASNKMLQQFYGPWVGERARQKGFSGRKVLCTESE